MRPLKTLSLLSLSPVYCSTCRNPSVIFQQALRLQCPSGLLPDSYPTVSSKRLSSTSVTRPNISYRIGAAFSAKGRRFNPKEDTFSFDPSREENTYTGRPNSGQDAFFVSRIGATNRLNEPTQIAFGVTDGVGGWADSGIDSADFSHGLCHWMSQVAKNESNQDHRNMPQSLLQKAYEEVVREGKIIGGGSTACVAIGAKDGSLSVAK